MTSISEFLKLFPELKGYDKKTQLLAYDIYLEDGKLDINEFLQNIKS